MYMAIPSPALSLDIFGSLGYDCMESHRSVTYNFSSFTTVYAVTISCAGALGYCFAVALMVKAGVAQITQASLFITGA